MERDQLIHTQMNAIYTTHKYMKTLINTTDNWKSVTKNEISVLNYQRLKRSVITRITEDVRKWFYNLSRGRSRIIY